LDEVNRSSFDPNIRKTRNHDFVSIIMIVASEASSLQLAEFVQIRVHPWIICPQQTGHRFGFVCGIGTFTVMGQRLIPMKKLQHKRVKDPMYREVLEAALPGQHRLGEIPQPYVHNDHCRIFLDVDNFCKWGVGLGREGGVSENWSGGVGES
jgi:hypothetical protein